MVLRKKLVVFKNYPSVLTKYVKRHQLFIKTLLSPQITQFSFFSCRTRYYSDYVFFAQSPGRLQPKHLDSLQRVLIRKFARLFRIWKSLWFTDMVTAKPNEIRMGKGKGAFSFWSKTVGIGKILFEIGFNIFLEPEYFFHVVRRLRAKLPIALGLVYRKPMF